MSGLSTPNEAVRLHAVDYLLKPVEDAVLVSTIQRIDSRAGGGKLHSSSVFWRCRHLPGTDIQTRSELLIKKCGRLYPEKIYRYDISQEIICDILNMSTGHFSKLFRQYYGVKFIDFLTNIRVEAAKELLLDPTKRTKRLEKWLVILLPATFLKFLGRKPGMTPSEYRTKYIESPR